MGTFDVQLDKIDVAEGEVDGVAVYEPLMVKIIKFMAKIRTKSIIFDHTIIFEAFQGDQLLRYNDMVQIHDVEISILVGDDLGLV